MQHSGKRCWEAGDMEAVQEARRPEVKSGQGMAGQTVSSTSSSSGLIQAFPVRPGWECLPLESNQPAEQAAKLPPTPSCSAGMGKLPRLGAE